MTKQETTNQTPQQESRWDRAYRAVEEARSNGTKPDESQFKDLTKSAGGN
jgi:hypothetical protein